MTEENLTFEIHGELYLTAILGSIFIDELNSDFERRTLKEQSQKAQQVKHERG